MKVRFNKFERVAGLFVLTSVGMGLAMIAGVAIRQGWFENKVAFETELQNADGVRVGTTVQMAGLRAGSVTGVDLKSGKNVHVRFEISEKYRDLVRVDSVVRTIRPFVISEKVLDVSIGDNTKPEAEAGGKLTSEATADIMDLVSGKTLAPHLAALGKMMENLKFVAEAILNPERSQDFIQIFDELHPLIRNMNGMSGEVSHLLHETNKDKKLVKMVNNLTMTTEEVNRMLPELNKIIPELAKLAPLISKDSPQLAADLSKIASNMAVLTDEIQTTMPAIKKTMQELGPEIPRASRRAMEALDETVVTLKALQKSFILKGSAQQVREEEAKRDDAKNRTPASVVSPSPGPAAAPPATPPALAVPLANPSDIPSDIPLSVPHTEPSVTPDAP